MKPVILFNFGYNRKGWIAPIEALKNDIEIVYLYYISKEQEKQRYTQQRVIYWNEYKTIDALLDHIKPQKVVMMSIDSGLGILLNYAAKKRNLPTYILQHGMFSNYKDYRAREKRMKKHGWLESEPATMRVHGFSTAGFFKASVKLEDFIHFIKFPVYYFLQKREGFRFACRWVRFDARMPSYYICYTPQNAIIHRELDNPPEKKFFYIGNPEMDAFVNYSGSQDTSLPYYLLIDQPLADNRYQEHLLSREEMINHYMKLNAFSLKHEAKLVVKLHPESFHSDWLPQHENIEWIKDHDDLPALVTNARGCFGYFSLLLIPAIIKNRVVLFKVSENEMQQDAQKLGLVKLLDFSASYSEIDFKSTAKDQLETFVRKYLYLTKGNSIERLKDVLLS